VSNPSSGPDSLSRVSQSGTARMDRAALTEESGGRRNAHIANLVLIVAIIGFSVTWWRALPERIPVHFDLSGNVDRWGSKGMMWWAFSGLALLGTGLIYGFARLSRRYPQLVNLPRKIRLTELPPAVAARALTLCQGLMYWLAVAMNVTWLLLLAAVRQAALGAPHNAVKLVLGTVGIGVLAVPAAVVMFYVRLGRLTKGVSPGTGPQ
jgi:uncharacterized membrane protein